QISRCARNDKGLGFVEAGLDTLLLVIPRSRSDEESAVLQLLVKKQISRCARNDKGLGFVEAGLDTLLLVIPRSRSDEESAVSPTLGQKQISRFARNDNAWVVGVVPTNSLHS